MQKKQNAFFVILGVLTLLMAGYTLFSTVYGQIITQNDGFFYIVICGGILILVFILLSLIIKLIVISPDRDEGVSLRVVEYVLVAIFLGMFLYMRLGYKTSLSASEAVYFKTAKSIIAGYLDVSADLHRPLTNNPAQYVMALFYLPFMSIWGESTELAFAINIGLYFVMALLIRRFVVTAAGHRCGMIAFALVLFMPGQAYIVYSFGAQLLLSVLFFAEMNLVLYMYVHTFFKKSWAVVCSISAVICGGLLLLAEPAFLIMYVLLLIGTLCYKKELFRNAIKLLLGIVVVFILLSVIKLTHLSMEPSELLSGYASNFNVLENMQTGRTNDIGETFENLENTVSSTDNAVEENYYFLTGANGKTITAISASWLSLSDQLIYMFMLLLCIVFVFYMMRNGYIHAILVDIMLLCMIFVLFFQVNRENSGFTFVSMIIAAGSIGIHFIFLNHHPDNAFAEYADVLESGDADEALAVSAEELEMKKKRAKALIFIGQDDALYQKIKAEESSTVVEPYAVSEDIVAAIDVQEEAIASAPEDMAAGMPEDTVATVVEEPVSDSQEFVPIKNPLPEPKAPTHQHIDFALQGSDDWDFDIEVADDDDFDFA